MVKSVGSVLVTFSSRRDDKPQAKIAALLYLKMTISTIPLFVAISFDKKKRTL